MQETRARSRSAQQARRRSAARSSGHHQRIAAFDAGNVSWAKTARVTAKRVLETHWNRKQLISRFSDDTRAIWVREIRRPTGNRQRFKGVDIAPRCKGSRITDLADN